MCGGTGGVWWSLGRGRNAAGSSGWRLHWALRIACPLPVTCSDADLPAYYRAADVHVCPSTAAAEAFSLVTLEAAASGIPTVASSLPGVRTVVVHGETGVHVAPSDPVSLGLVLDSLVNGPARTARGRAARARAEAHFRWEPAIIRLEQTYREVVGSVRGAEA